MKITVSGDPRIVVHQNLILVRANSPDQAYRKARHFGEGQETSYDNPAGELVTFKFEGLSSLADVYEELADGAEISFQSTVGLSDQQIRSIVRPRKQLAVFVPPMRARGPDYSSRGVLEMLEKDYGVKRVKKIPPK
jgi:hypothetical protein